MKKVIVLMSLLVIIVVGAFAWFNMNTQSLQPQLVKPSPTPGQPVSNNSGMRVESNSVYVSGQGESNELTVSMVTLAESGYVVIHEDTNGQPGAVLGESELLSPGTHNNIPVQLSRKTVNGEIIYAMLHKDNGDKVFSLADEPIKGRDNEAMMMIVTVEETSETAPDAISM